MEAASDTSRRANQNIEGEVERSDITEAEGKIDKKRIGFNNGIGRPVGDP